MGKSDNQIIIFKTEDEKISIDVRFDEETVWLTIDDMANLFEKSRSTINEHILNVFEEGELDESTSKRKIGISDFSTKPTNYYNLDVIISVGYRVKSLRGTQFRQWATSRLNEYIRKGFTMDDERLKQGGNRYFRELLQRIRDIRSSERNFYQQITDVYATAVDYDPHKDITKTFFATVQNKMHFAVHHQTAAEVIYNRVDNEKPMVGMTNFKNEYITKSDVKIAKNYLDEEELNKLNLLSSNFLDYAELQAAMRRGMTMHEWADYLDNQLKTLRMEVLMDKGGISHKQAVEKAEKEFELYRAREMKQLESDFDRAVKQLSKKDNVETKEVE